VTTSAEQIRALRARRGWTQLEVAQNLDRLAWTQTGKHVGVNADMVAKWERGVKAPSRRYQELLDCLFGGEHCGTIVTTGTDDADTDPISTLVAQTGLLLDRLGRDALILSLRLNLGRRVLGFVHDQLSGLGGDLAHLVQDRA